MEKIMWDDRYKMGVEAVDRAHAKLFRIVNKLFDLSQDASANQAAYKEGIKYLEAYSMTHFSEEEAYMRSIRYGGYAEHKRIHDNFRNKTLISLKKDLELSGYSSSAVERFVGIMGSWLTEHIMLEDQAIVGKVVRQKKRDLSTQIDIISKTVHHAVKEVLQTETKLVSTEYKGQNIGNGYYCCQYYQMGGGVVLQLLLGVEDVLFLRGIERIPGIRKREMTERDVLHVFGQLFERMGRLFKVETKPEFGPENLLSRDNFRKEFMKGCPCSLLFGTRSGALAFCYRSWKEKKHGGES
ncbi:MAG: hemerythrin family protein [Lachnospiraceae bacterium]|jgi:hemerythrin-like metal-binding protein|nr:hemerythrin family protein [Lachnospiraceae bacterium]